VPVLAGYETQYAVATNLRARFTEKELPADQLGKYSASLLLAGWKVGTPIEWSLREILEKGLGACLSGLPVAPALCWVSVCDCV
jgi:hypothetical protein